LRWWYGQHDFSLHTAKSNIPGIAYKKLFMLILKVQNWYGHVILTTEHGKKRSEFNSESVMIFPKPKVNMVMMIFGQFQWRNSEVTKSSSINKPVQYVLQ
jgi:hypothetical protein